MKKKKKILYYVTDCAVLDQYSPTVLKSILSLSLKSLNNTMTDWLNHFGSSNQRQKLHSFEDVRKIDAAHNFERRLANTVHGRETLLKCKTMLTGRRYEP